MKVVSYAGRNEYEIFMGNDRKIFGAEAQDGTFLSANVLLWSVTTFIVGMFFCTAIGKIALIDCIANVMCVAVYAGVIGGVIGGFLFLIHRHNGKKL